MLVFVIVCYCVLITLLDSLARKTSPIICSTVLFICTCIYKSRGVSDKWNILIKAAIVDFKTLQTCIMYKFGPEVFFSFRDVLVQFLVNNKKLEIL